MQRSPSATWAASSGLSVPMPQLPGTRATIPAIWSFTALTMSIAGLRDTAVITSAANGVEMMRAGDAGVAAHLLLQVEIVHVVVRHRRQPAIVGHHVRAHGHAAQRLGDAEPVAGADATAQCVWMSMIGMVDRARR